VAEERSRLAPVLEKRAVLVELVEHALDEHVSGPVIPMVDAAVEAG
jgi:hypothetical protein